MRKKVALYVQLIDLTLRIVIVLMVILNCIKNNVESVRVHVKLASTQAQIV
jgi:hypothetical protein